MRLASSTVLCFDLRLRVQLKLNEILTFDVNRWVQPETILRERFKGEISVLTGLDDHSLTSKLDSTFMSYIPRAWLHGQYPFSETVVLIALASEVVGLTREDSLAEVRGGACSGDAVTYKELVDAGWMSVGFDICDDALSTSLLYTSDESSVLPLVSRDGAEHALNKHGLLTTFQIASDYSKYGASLLPDHVGFSPVEILLAP